MTANGKKTNFSITEQPISDRKDDYFDVEPRIVNKIFDVIDDKSTGKITIAITGEWGIGKSSAINLLRNRLIKDKKNIIVNFEPLSEGKFEIADIIGLFYLKLYKELSGSGIGEVIKKCLKSIAILSRAKITGDVELDASAIGIPGKIGLKSEYNWSDNVDALLDLWEKEKPKDFSEQTKELNEALLKNGYRLYIFIDEIDRLPANYIINFLLFCRILESFDNMVCVVGIDYEQVINKLKKESALCLDDYAHAQSYLDKLFQIKQHVHHNRYKKINYAISKLRDLDCDRILNEIIETDNYEIRAKLEGIIDYLSTPRQIKKWLIALRVNYSIIKYSQSHKLDVMAFVAATIKHPIFIDYLSKHALRILNEKWRLKHFIGDQYGVNFLDIKDKDYEIIAASMGIKFLPEKDSKTFQPLIDEFIGKLRVQHIDDFQAGGYLVNYLETSEYLITLFVEGFVDENQVALYDKFFGGGIDDALKMLAIDDSNMNVLASDLAEALRKRAIKLSGVPTIQFLNNIWAGKINDNDFINPYETIILYSLQKASIEKIISDCFLGLSEASLSAIFHVCGFKNKNGIYNLDDVSVAPDDDISRKGMQNVTFNNIGIKEFDKETIKQIINVWVAKVEMDLASKRRDIYNQVKLISIFYRYVQWSLAIGSDVRAKLADLVVKYFQDTAIPVGDKEYLKRIIKNEKEKFDSQKWGMEKNPMETLFDNASEIIQIIDG